jgi:hypothetical protein
LGQLTYLPNVQFNWKLTSIENVRDLRLWKANTWLENQIIIIGILCWLKLGRSWKLK